MCQSSVYAIDGGRQELLLEEASRLKVEGDELTIEALIGTPVSLAARIREIDLLNHRIVVERI